MSNQVMWFESTSADIPASAKFYGDLFDWPFVTDEKMDYTMTATEPGEMGMGLAPVDEARGMMPGGILIYVDVADVDATIARAKELGGQVLQGKTEIPTVGWMAIFGEPGGNRIAVMQRAPSPD